MNTDGSIERAQAESSRHQYDFGQALMLLRQGARMARSGWNGQGQFLYWVPGSEFLVSRAPLLGIYPEGTPIRYRPHIDIRLVDGSVAV